MDQAIFDVPSMYADHHVLVVRELLTGLDGVGDVYASSAFKQVMVQYDPAAIQSEDIAGVLDRGRLHPRNGSSLCKVNWPKIPGKTGLLA